jgi:alpha-tubulin suppressor-like RCC1 family protein
MDLDPRRRRAAVRIAAVAASFFLAAAQSCGGRASNGIPGDAGGDTGDSGGPTLAAARAIALGGDHACALLSDQTVACWGNLDLVDPFFEAGAPEPRSPTRVPALGGITQVAAGSLDTCVVFGDGGAACWGDATYGQIGNGTGYVLDDSGFVGQTQDTPAPVSGLGNARMSSVGASHACALLADGSIACWGDYLALGIPLLEAGANVRPAIVPGIAHAAEVAAGLGATCARVPGEPLWCWGQDLGGQIGDVSADGGVPQRVQLSPKAVPGLPPAAQVAMGQGFVCAVMQDTTVWCWGSDRWGETGSSTPGSQPPHPVPGLTGVAQLAAGGSHACATLQDGSVKCWGDNGHGQLGLGMVDTTDAGVAVPTSVPGLTDVDQVAAGDTHTCALLHDGAVLCWGGNSVGQLGLGSAGPDVPTPTRIPW